MHLPLLKPALYAPAPSASGEGGLLTGASALLKGGICAGCGGVFFPMQVFGCEACGATELQPLDLAGEGELVALAQVYSHAGDARATPFTVGSIRLAAGPRVRTLLNSGVGEPLHTGQAMRAVLLEVIGPNGEPVLDLRFQAAQPNTDKPSGRQQYEPSASSLDLAMSLQPVISLPR